MCRVGGGGGGLSYRATYKDTLTSKLALAHTRTTFFSRLPGLHVCAPPTAMLRGGAAVGRGGGEGGPGGECMDGVTTFTVSDQERVHVVYEAQPT